MIWFLPIYEHRGVCLSSSAWFNFFVVLKYHFTILLLQLGLFIDILFLIFITFIYLCLCVYICGECIHVDVRGLLIRVDSFHHVSSGGQTQVIILGGSHLYSQSHFTGLDILLFETIVNVIIFLIFSMCIHYWYVEKQLIFIC